MRAFTLCAALLGVALPVAAHAGVEAYSGTAGEKLYIESAPKLGPRVSLIMFEGVDSKWSGKIFRTELRETTGGARVYAFEYDLELSSGVQKRTYEVVVDAGHELVNGSRVRKIHLYIQERPKRPLDLNYDADLTKSSAKIDLLARHTKKPYKPDVD